MAPQCEVDTYEVEGLALPALFSCIVKIAALADSRYTRLM